MAQNSKIEWTDHTFNPWIGCSKVSAGCRECYAETLMDTRYGRVKWGPHGTRVRTAAAYWKKPHQWNRKAQQEGRRYRVFCASLADVFEDRPELEPWRKELFALIDATPHLDWLLLTKRPENIARMWGGAAVVEGVHYAIVRSNVALGVSVEDQAAADQRIPQLLRVAHLCRFTFLSCEPLLGPVDLMLWMKPTKLHTNADGFIEGYGMPTLLHWVIGGGESGTGHPRPMHPDWPRSLRDQCAAAGVPFFFKQHGAWISGRFDRRKGKMICDQAPGDLRATGRIFWTNPGAPKVHLWNEADHYWTHASAMVGKHAAGNLLDGRTHQEFPDRPAPTTQP